jgi:hypothetical protein
LTATQRAEAAVEAQAAAERQGATLKEADGKKKEKFMQVVDMCKKLKERNAAVEAALTAAGIQLS